LLALGVVELFALNRFMSRRGAIVDLLKPRHNSPLKKSP